MFASLTTRFARDQNETKMFFTGKELLVKKSPECENRPRAGGKASKKDKAIDIVSQKTTNETHRRKKDGPIDIVSMPVWQTFQLKELEFADYNPRHITEDGKRGLQEAIEDFGVLEAPVVNVFGGKKRLVSGHQRVTVMLAGGVEKADCIRVCFDDTKEKIANLTMNNRAIQGSWDVEKALPSLQSIIADMPTPDLAGFSGLMSEVQLEVGKIQQADSRKAREKIAEDSKPKIMDSVSGKVYKLGKHRLYCGNMETGIGKILGLKKADACITDPPYNVDYGDYSGVGIQNDKMTPDNWNAFVSKFCQLILRSTSGASCIFMSLKELPTLALSWEANGGMIHRFLFWAKDNFVVGHSDYHYQHEPVLFGYKSGFTPSLPEVARTNVFEHPKLQGKHELHVTQKPLEIIRAMINDVTEKNGSVLDPFGGSGTTLVLCEELGRTCYTCEIDTYYADVIRKRWAQQVHGDGCDWVKLTPTAS